MADERRPTIHAMPVETLRTRTREAQRLVEQARALVRASFERNVSPDSGREKQVGGMLDAIERLLPGIGLLAVQRVGDRDRERRDSLPIATPREKTREQIDRAEMIASTSEALAGLLQDIERGRSTAPARIDVPPSTMPPAPKG